MSVVASSHLLRIAREYEAAAAQLAQDTKILVRLSFVRHNLEKSELEHGAESFTVQWMVPLFGRHELSNKLNVTPDCKKHLKIDAGTRMSATLRFELVRAKTTLESMFRTNLAEPIIEGYSYPAKDSIDELLMRDSSNNNPWLLKLTYHDKVLSTVSFVHNSAEHAELTDYLFELAKQHKHQELLSMSV